MSIKERIQHSKLGLIISSIRNSLFQWSPFLLKCSRCNCKNHFFRLIYFANCIGKGCISCEHPMYKD